VATKPRGLEQNWGLCLPGLGLKLPLAKEQRKLQNTEEKC